MKKKPSNAPVFLIYAGVIHAVGLALLLPMLITLPGPGREVATEPAAIDVEIIPASPPTGAIEPEGEQTSALPAGAATSADDPSIETGEQAESSVLSGTEAEPEEKENALPQEEPEKADIAAPEQAKLKAIAAKPAAKKAAAPRRSVRAVARRPGKKDAKIAPFNGALSGLFSPGAPARRR